MAPAQAQPADSNAGPAIDRLTEPDRHGYFGHVKKVRIAELKNNLSRFLDHVRGGGEVLVLDRDQPIARIVPLASGESADKDYRLARLERQGLLRRGRGGLPTWIEKPRPRLKASLLKEFLAQRRRGW